MKNIRRVGAEPCKDPDLIGYVKKIARFAFAKFGTHTPTVVAKIQNRLEVYAVVFAGTPNEVQECKDNFAAFLVQLAGKADEIVFVQEAWMKTYEKDDPNVVTQGLEHVEGRTEHLICNHYTPQA